MRNALTVAGVELRLFLRDRSNLFFVFVFPLLLVLMIGLQFGEGARSGRVAVSGPDSHLRAAIVRELDADDVIVSEPAWDDALELLARGRLDAAVQVDDAAASAYDVGQDLTLEVVRGSSANAQVVEQQVRTAVDALRAERGRLVALEAYDVPAERAREALAAAEGQVSPPVLEVTNVDELSQEFAGLGQFDFGASGQLLLFVFLSCLAGSATLIQARRLGVVSRMLAGPMTAGQLVAGQVLGRWAIGLFQGGYIMLASSVLFDVRWGNLALSLLVLLLFSLGGVGRGDTARDAAGERGRCRRSGRRARAGARRAGRLDAAARALPRHHPDRREPHAARVGLRRARRHPAPQRHPRRRPAPARSAGRHGVPARGPRRLVVASEPVAGDVNLRRVSIRRGRAQRVP